MKINKELLKGSTSMLVLSLLENENMYGYQMIKELSRKSKELFELKEGTLYPILHALEQKNYIISYWDETGAKKRKYYSITKDGDVTVAVATCVLLEGLNQATLRFCLLIHTFESGNGHVTAGSGIRLISFNSHLRFSPLLRLV